MPPKNQEACFVDFLEAFCFQSGALSGKAQPILCFQSGDLLGKTHRIDVIELSNGLCFFGKPYFLKILKVFSVALSLIFKRYIPLAKFTDKLIISVCMCVSS